MLFVYVDVCLYLCVYNIEKHVEYLWKTMFFRCRLSVNLCMLHSLNKNLLNEL